jgi:hypothetical protein
MDSRNSRREAHEMAEILRGIMALGVLVAIAALMLAMQGCAPAPDGPQSIYRGTYRGSYTRNTIWANGESQDSAGRVTIVVDDGVLSIDGCVVNATSTGATARLLPAGCEGAGMRKDTYETGLAEFAGDRLRVTIQGTAEELDGRVGRFSQTIEAVR